MQPSTSEPVPGRWLIAPALWFLASFALMAWLTGRGFYHLFGLDADVKLFYQWGSAPLRGVLPYRDFEFAYPPGALPALTLPAVLGPSLAGYRFWFAIEMLVCGIATVVLAIATLARLGATRRELAVSSVLLGTMPLLIGPLLSNRFDLWPAALLSGCLAAIAFDRSRVAAVLLGLAIAAKLYAIVAVPVLAIYLWRRVGARATFVAGAVLLATVAVVVVPYAIVSGWQILYPLSVALDRPLQIETLGGAVLVVLHEAFGLPISVNVAFFSNNVTGALPRLLSLAQLVALALLLLVVYLRSALQPQTVAVALVAVAASITAFVALGKVYSDQYVIWLIPLVAVIPGRVGTIAIGTVAGIAVVSTWFFPSHYAEYVYGGHLGVAVVVLIRVVATVAVSLLLAWAIRARAGRPA